MRGRCEASGTRGSQAARTQLMQDTGRAAAGCSALSSAMAARAHAGVVAHSPKVTSRIAEHDPKPIPYSCSCGERLGTVLTSEVQGPVGQHAPHCRQDFVKQAAPVPVRTLHTSRPCLRLQLDDRVLYSWVTGSSTKAPAWTMQCGVV